VPIFVVGTETDHLALGVRFSRFSCLRDQLGEEEASAAGRHLTRCIAGGVGADCQLAVSAAHSGTANNPAQTNTAAIRKTFRAAMTRAADFVSSGSLLRDVPRRGILGSALSPEIVAARDVTRHKPDLWYGLWLNFAGCESHAPRLYERDENRHRQNRVPGIGRLV